MIGFFNKFEVKGIALLRRVFGRDALFGHELSNVDSLVKGLHYAYTPLTSSLYQFRWKVVLSGILKHSFQNN